MYLIEKGARDYINKRLAGVVEAGRALSPGMIGNLISDLQACSGCLPLRLAERVVTETGTMIAPSEGSKFHADVLVPAEKVDGPLTTYEAIFRVMNGIGGLQCAVRLPAKSPEAAIAAARSALLLGLNIADVEFVSLKAGSTVL